MDFLQIIIAVSIGLAGFIMWVYNICVIASLFLGKWKDKRIKIIINIISFILLSSAYIYIMEY